MNTGKVVACVEKNHQMYQKNDEIPLTIGEKIGRAARKTSTIMWIIFLFFVFVVAFGMFAYTYVEKCNMGTAMSHTLLSISGRENDDQRIKHAILAPIFYLLVWIGSILVFGILLFEVTKRFFKRKYCGKCNSAV